MGYFKKNMLLKYCVCFLFVNILHARVQHKSKGAKISGIDLLNGLSFTTNIHQSTHLNNHGWTSPANNSGETTYINLHKIIHKKTREITVDLIGFSYKKSLSKLFGIYLKHKPLPLFEISIDAYRRKVYLRYQGERSFQRVTIGLGKEIVGWTVLSVNLNTTHFTVTVGCDTEKSVPLRQKLNKIPRRAVGILGSGKLSQHRFVGHLFEARLYSGQVNKKILLCSQPVNLNSFLAQYHGYVNDGAINGDRILLLEQQITQLNKIVDTLKEQNANLTDRVAGLDGCCDTECMWDGQVYDEGDTWTPDKCTVCICKNQKSDCLIRTDVPSCQTPCSSSPCMNQGQCYSFEDAVPDDFMCQCQPPYDGPYCEFKENPCVWPRESGICDQNLPRFYYDTDNQQCLQFNYSGCGGNINNYESLDDCQAVSIKGACCFRQYSVKAQDVLISSQNETFGCKEISLSECQSTHRTVVEDLKLEVISFYPGVACKDAKCGFTDMSCMIDDRKYKVGDKAVLGCQECTCMSSGQFVCSCSKKAERKEIRDMTSEELAQFQAAVQQLRLVGPGNPWEEFRDIYMRHSMHANGGPYFLPWHRVFLHRFEQRLQEIDCSITLPYFEFITDIGKFEEAIIWQPNYFGGNGTDRSCVIDHPFGLPGSWRPCITRRFDQNVNLPTMLELSLALASEDYKEMSRCLEAFVSYIHTYIGGEMATSAAPYDPVFYSIHAYIDMLYWSWQKKGSNKFNYPAEFSNIPMIPFNMPPSAIFDLEADLCVTYVLPSTGSPCNVTEDPEKIPERGDISPEGDEVFVGEYNTLGYNIDGYDRRGLDKAGYNQKGFNRDGYNRLGFDINGYNRYGYDSDRYSRYGYDMEGYDRDIMPDDTGRYNAYGLDLNCLDRRGLTTEGYDRYGFNIYGYNRERCNYFNKGPYSTIQSQRIWNILLKQSKPFLMSLMRTCPSLKPLSHNWLQQYWITDIKDVSDIVKVASQSQSEEKNSARFCFDIDDFVTPCGCDVGIATCTENPCQTMACPSYPEASCRVDFCGVCKDCWHLNGKEVDCFEERDFCVPSPCENGGTCVPSIWPSEPQLTTCQCPPGFDGHYCQYTALDVCELPVSRGQCAKQESRWYFDSMTQTCKSFLYTGCAGNANNFVSKDLCQARCRIGACCYRSPKKRDAIIGYDTKGYDRYGFNVLGQNRRGDLRTEDNGIKTGTARFSSSRYDEKGYDRNDFDSQGYDRFGLDKSGYDVGGFNLLGNSRQGEYDGIIDYNEEGYDEEGFNRAGYSCSGTNREGLNVYGTYSDYVYRCRSATLAQCQKLEQDKGHQVVKFSPGKRCEEVNCTVECGCSYNGQSYLFGQKFKSGCQFCTCTYTGFVECVCPEIFRRKEIRDLTEKEMRTYQNAIKQVVKTAFPSKWYQNAEIFAKHKPQAIGNSASLPWHRYFLSMVERQLQETDCSITIPYYDWTLHAGNQQRSTIWAANMFGGDGIDINGCVENHPFKDYYPPYWVPCLRRQFNTSIQLPDVVDIQYALNEETYERFRLSMEVYFDIFKSWVGGTMATDYAPYDPLYLSVAAFIDRIWWDWQSKHENALLNYPQDKRYIPMMPFKATPDDVMHSKKQMCVTYFPLSEGAVCNITQINLNFNTLGYDRHGFNREGYDIEGYNVFGLDKDGNADERGIYNVNGFDREGFKRNGYDKSGFDRFGFFVDGYNVDGYDSTGYDRTGYDRFGFDRTGVTPFGFHRNGTLLIDSVPTNFDPYGYNRYGLNRYGFDRQGTDIFGFDSFGYDKQRCNRHYLGPMLVIIKRWAELELEKTDKPTIRIITRICPAITNLPEWRFTTNWLRRDEQLPLIEGIVGRAQQRVQGLLPGTVRDKSITENNVWLPLGADRNLCFVTYYYTECPFGEYPVSCVEELCTGRKCPGYPDAVCRVNRCGSCSYEWYNGITGNQLECSGCVDRTGVDRTEGSTWSVSECESCTCQDGLVSCAEIQCPPVTCSYPVKILGQCCLLCDAGCDYNGQIRRNGQRFPSPTDQCQECDCLDGNVQCVEKPCPALDQLCDSPTYLEGECCPQCLDCGLHANGENWNETPCQECTCLDGQVLCERIRCIPPDCSHPWVPPGQCCSVCDGCTVDGRDMQSGETYQPEQCTECQCYEGNLRCDFLPCPIAPCLNPITPQGECCPRCDNDCEYNFRSYRHMQSFISQDDNCTNCTCDNGFVNCVPVTCPRMNLPCRRPVTLPGECCPTTCPKCLADGVEYETGRSWKSANDPCETCRCDEGIVVCQRQDRCPMECDHGVVRSGECCSQCTDCVFSGQYVWDAQVFVRPGDNCQQCTCSSGQVTCESLGPCPRVPCRVTETPPGACCPQCKRCEYEGAMYTHGDVVYSDSCSQCTCLDGEVSCERETCLELTCRNPVPVPGQCCPVCLECQYKGQTYQDGQRFTPPREPCHDCECRGGDVTCLSQEKECPISRCTHPMKTRRQCCGTCDGCSFMRRRFRNGQKFVPPGLDNCKVCRCVDGSVECNNMGCPAVNCENAVLVKGQCCPVCPMGCNVMGIEYRDGQTFIDFMNRCQVCTCMMGQIRCMQMMTCPAVTCTHPANRPGNCCPSCSMCEQNSMQYRNGEQFTNPSDPCQQCVCRYGSIACTPKVTSCPRVGCDNPVLNPDTCCPACANNGCMYAGRQYQDGQEVPASRDTCEMCECSGGIIDCKRQQCPVVNCRNPGRTECCETCEFCEFNGMNLELGKQFPSPNNPCEECVCMAGSVDCQRLYCDIPNCSNPSLIPGACCPQCTDCTYQGLLFRDGEDFQNPVNPCENCHCMKGSVACDRTQCPKVDCPNPVKDGCCLRCTHCSYRNRRYENGEDFQSVDGCGVCKCVDGRVQCDSKNCAEVTCEHPIRNQCCEECTDCLYQGMTIRNGQSIPDPANECGRCVCRYGTVSCEMLPCQPVTCLNPSYGKCCPECRDCNYFGEIVQHGSSVPSIYEACEECRCAAGSIRCSNKTCPPATCLYPVQSECCRNCDGCSINGRNYLNGGEVSMPNSSCEMCSCRNGNLMCTKRQCPAVQCENPILGQCCPECPETICTHNNLEYRDGDMFDDATDKCVQCQCFKGSIRCTKRQCPAVQCKNPVLGQCCPECPETTCTHNNLEYRDGEMFDDARDKCVQCQCFKGSIRCTKRQCPAVQCKNPVLGQCCPECPETTCTYNNLEYRDGEMFDDARDKCVQCQCLKGSIRCRKVQCQPVTCTNPVTINCCPSCRDCSYQGQTIQHGKFVTARNDTCDRCRCESGSIKCYGQRCPTVSCTNPVKSGCCDLCDACSFEGLSIQNNERFKHPADPCQKCTCSKGNVVCRRETCPTLNCLDPVQGECCLQCPRVKNCVYKGRQYRDGGQFRDTSDPCVECVCQEGVVTCSNQCPAKSCLHPNQGQCDDCYYGRKAYRNGQSFREDCKNCLCSDGSVQCTSISCPSVSCLNPKTVDCCPVCNDTCSHGDRLLRNGDTLPDARDPCSTCMCKSGSFECTKQQCPAITCRHPAMGPCCPECYNCQVGARKIPHGEVYPDPTNVCSLCMCNGGNINCERRPCPSPYRGCSHPIDDECGCPTCGNGCKYEGLVVTQGQTFTDPHNRCQECVCRSGYVRCNTKACLDKCTHPADTDGCCPICRSCRYDGKIQVDGAAFTADRDPCLECQCQGGNVNCTRRVCPKAECDNPTADPGQCCASCPTSHVTSIPLVTNCVYNGRNYRDMEAFASQDDKCVRCTCVDGRVHCEREQCNDWCSHPRPGRCCPSCDLCFYSGTLYNHNSTFTPEPCEICNCMNGSVTCSEKTCPNLSCREQETRQGECCPVCKGCTYDGILYENGAEWQRRDDPCVTCTCSTGKVTCSTVKCVTPCPNPVTLPGQCCPICPTCRYNEVIYTDGESFSPSGDPCDICTCQKGQLQCYHDPCPHLKDCPLDQQQGPEPNTCCPICTALSSCTRERFGEVRRQVDDPCRYCLCNNFQWDCKEEECPDLPCPVEVQVYREGVCCPKCPACYDVSTGTYYLDGREWQHRDNNCLYCACQSGYIHCEPIYCSPAECTEGETLVLSPDECCPKCERADRLECLYQGVTRQELEEWRPDDCTTCQCSAGSVVCSSQACMVPICSREDSLTVLPGTCCPVCLPKPGTCLVYGDPHYRTFDGSTLHFQGSCKYVMATECDSSDFVVEVHHDDRGINGVSWAQNFTLRTSGIKVEILQNHYVLVNDQQVPTPYRMNTDLSIDRMDDSILVNTKYGVKLVWDGRSYAELTVPGNYKRKMCGLCGNFNGFPQDDMRTKNGQITSSPAVFGNSWKVTDQITRTCADATDADPCNAVSYRQRKEAASMCEILSGEQFSSCHRAVPVGAYYSSCVYDLCACTDRSTCLCDVLSSYAKECAKAGVRLEWRSQTLCSIDCDSSKGFIFDECGPVCQRTCDNWHTALGDLTENCYKPCVASCQCTADKVVHNGQCISTQECPP